MPSKLKLKVGFLGSGRMATALARGLVQTGLVDKAAIIASDPVDAARAAFAKEVGARTTVSNIEVVETANVLVLAVKPDQVKGVLSGIRGSLSEEHLLISIAAGVPIGRIESELEEGSRIIRGMPNTPALVATSATAYALGKNATSDDGKLAQQLFAAVGITFPLKEALLDAVTGLSGSGPAYGYMIIEALSDGGVAAGLPRDVATKLAAQTMLGSARMVIETGQHPGALKDMVTSPGGTTIEGVHQLEKGNLRGTLINAVRAASEKSKQLGQG